MPRRIDSYRLESAARFYSRYIPIEFTRATGATVVARNGKTYIDFLTCCGALNYGHNHPVIKEALIKYIVDDGVASSLDMFTMARREFMSEFWRVILHPRQMNYRMMFAGPSGTDAVEAALKLARRATGRSNIVAFTGAFHGVSLGSLAATAFETQRTASGVPLEHIVRMPFDGYFGGSADTISIISAMLESADCGIDAPAAFLVEVVQGESGLRAASKGWLKDLAELARRLNSLLIVDDIQAGCGRTGAFFSFEEAGIEPDIVCLSKSLSGYGLPLAMILAKPELDMKWVPGGHTGTFRGFNHAFVTGRAAAHLWEQEAFRTRIAEVEDSVNQWIVAVCKQDWGSSIESRGRGIFRGIKVGSRDAAEQIRRSALNRGLIMENSGASGDILKIMPPINISEEELTDGLDRLRVSIAEVLQRK